MSTQNRGQGLDTGTGRHLAPIQRGGASASIAKHEDRELSLREIVETVLHKAHTARVGRLDALKMSLSVIVGRKPEIEHNRSRRGPIECHQGRGCRAELGQSADLREIGKLSIRRFSFFLAGSNVLSSLNFCFRPRTDIRPQSGYVRIVPAAAAGARGTCAPNSAGTNTFIVSMD